MPQQNGEIRGRSLEFWVRAGGIYAGYKAAQAKALVLRVSGKSQDWIRDEHWKSHHDRAGKQMHDLCVDMRGFFIKAGQFVGARSDFVPEEVCAWLRKLQDEVPPLPSDAVKAQLTRELGCATDDIFESIELERPLGSASIAQVHKARLRQYEHRPSALQRIVTAPARLLLQLAGFRKRVETQSRQKHIVTAGEDLWMVANEHGVTMAELQAVNKKNSAVTLSQLQGGDILWLPATCSNLQTEDPEAHRKAIIEAVRRANKNVNGPANGVVAVKVQYPNALPLFIQDLQNIRSLAFFLTKTEIPFDMVSAVDELSSQVKLEFDFRREARVMDTVAADLRGIRRRVVVPTSVPGLVTREVLVMDYIDGIPLSKLGSVTTDMSEQKRKMAFKRVIARASEAYGRMILGSGLFQADAHPGNILVMKRGRVGLIDYGQSKQLSCQDRLLFARLLLAMHTSDDQRISDALDDMGVVTEPHLVPVRATMARGMFDTSGTVDPFDKDSPIKQCAIVAFPKQMFLILRVVQLFRGLSTRMGVEFSNAEQWLPLAIKALENEGDTGERKGKYYGL